MVVASMKHITSNFAKLNKFEGVDFRRWQKKMHFLLSSMSVVYVLTTPIPKDGENATVDQIRRRNKWDNNDHVCRGLILNGMSDPLFDIYRNVSCIIDKRPPSWKDFNHTLKHNKEELTLVELGSHLRIEESLKAQDSDKPKGNNVVGPQKDVRLPDPKLIEPNESVSIKSIIESRDAIFDENKLSSVPRPSLMIPNETEDIGGSVVPKEVTEGVQQPEPELRKGKRNRTPKNFGHEFQLYLIEGTRVEVSDQHSYCFNVEDDPKTFDEVMKS
ncbi:hypothetical protein Tco_1211276 [Tanacetum coccineum]